MGKIPFRLSRHKKPPERPAGDPGDKGALRSFTVAGFIPRV